MIRFLLRSILTVIFGSSSAPTLSFLLRGAIMLISTSPSPHSGAGGLTRRLITLCETQRFKSSSVLSFTRLTETVVESITILKSCKNASSNVYFPILRCSLTDTDKKATKKTFYSFFTKHSPGL